MTQSTKQRKAKFRNRIPRITKAEETEARAWYLAMYLGGNDSFDWSEPHFNRRQVCVVAAEYHKSMTARERGER